MKTYPLTKLTHNRHPDYEALGFAALIALEESYLIRKEKLETYLQDGQISGAQNKAAEKYYYDLLQDILKKADFSSPTGIERITQIAKEQIKKTMDYTPEIARKELSDFI